MYPHTDEQTQTEFDYILTAPFSKELTNCPLKQNFPPPPTELQIFLMDFWRSCRNYRLLEPPEHNFCKNMYAKRSTNIIGNKHLENCTDTTSLSPAQQPKFKIPTPAILFVVYSEFKTCLKIVKYLDILKIFQEYCKESSIVS